MKYVPRIFSSESTTNSGIIPVYSPAAYKSLLVQRKSEKSAEVGGNIVDQLFPPQPPRKRRAGNIINDLARRPEYQVIGLLLNSSFANSPVQMSRCGVFRKNKCRKLQTFKAVSSNHTGYVSYHT